MLAIVKNEGITTLRTCSRIAAGLAGAGVLLLTAVTINEQTAAGPPQAGQEVKAVRVAKPPMIDGAVDESEWQETATASGFIQYEPRRSDIAETRTEVRVSYDASHLGFKPRPCGRS
jgi:hypothetical protein